MAHDAREMEREGFELPLLIGGATTSRTHTAVKIAPNYTGAGDLGARRVARASACARNLLSDELRAGYVAEVKADYERIRAAARGEEGPAPLVPLGGARANALKTDWTSYAPPQPALLGRKLLPRTTISPRSRATSTGGRSSRPGSFPAATRRSSTTRWSARRRATCSPTGRRCSKKIIEDNWLTANAVFGLFPANAVGRRHRDLRRRGPREPAMVAQPAPADEEAGRSHNFCLADFVAPKTSGVRDYIGAFAVTAGHRHRGAAREFEAAHDDYSAIMLKALADRLAEALTELLHPRVRREFWGYAPDETLDERRADRGEVPRHPAGARLSGLPRPHREGTALRAARAPEAGITLTESYAMYPASSVSGFYFSHPECAVLRRRQDRPRPGRGLRAPQAVRLAKIERWLAPVLAYDT